MIISCCRSIFALSALLLLSSSSSPLTTPVSALPSHLHRPLTSFEIRGSHSPHEAASGHYPHLIHHSSTHSPHPSVFRPHSGRVHLHDLHHEPAHPEPHVHGVPEREDGLTQHYPKHIQFNFQWGHTNHTFQLTLMEQLYAPFSTSQLHVMKTEEEIRQEEEERLLMAVEEEEEEAEEEQELAEEEEAEDEAGEADEIEVIRRPRPSVSPFHLIEVPNRLVSYAEHWESGFITLTLHADRTFSAQIVNPHGRNHPHDFHRFRQETIQIDPIRAHKQQLSEEEYEELKESSQHGVAIFRHESVRNQPWMSGCAAHDKAKHDHEGMEVDRSAEDPARSDSQVENDEEADDFDLASSSSSSSSSSLSSSSSRRRLLQLHFTPSVLASSLRKWTKCFPGDDKGVTESVGLHADSSLVSQCGGVQQTRDVLAAMYAGANSVWFRQIGVYLQVGKQDIRAGAGAGGEDWNQAAGACRHPSINDAFYSYYNFLQAKKLSGQSAIWMLHTACYPSGNDGVAQIAGACTNINVGAVSGPRWDWLALAHEIGHLNGAKHTFQLGQGKTGGLMDYGDKLLGGIYQFNEKYSRPEICPYLTHLTTVKDSKGTTCLKPYTGATPAFAGQPTNTTATSTSGGASKTLERGGKGRGNVNVNVNGKGKGNGNGNANKKNQGKGQVPVQGKGKPAGKPAGNPAGKGKGKGAGGK